MQRELPFTTFKLVPSESKVMHMNRTVTPSAMYMYIHKVVSFPSRLLAEGVTVQYAFIFTSGTERKAGTNLVCIHINAVKLSSVPA